MTLSKAILIVGPGIFVVVPIVVAAQTRPLYEINKFFFGKKGHHNLYFNGMLSHHFSQQTV